MLQKIEAFDDVVLDRFGEIRAETAVHVEPDHLFDRLAHVQKVRRVIEQLDVTPVPGTQAQITVDHADRLADIVECDLQCLPVELQRLTRGVEQLIQFFGTGVARVQRCMHQVFRGGCADTAGQQVLRLLQDLRRGGKAAVPRHVVAELEEELHRTLLAGKPTAQLEHVDHSQLVGGPLCGRFTLIDIGAGLQSIGKGRFRPQREKHVRSNVSGEAPEHSMGQRIVERHAQQRLRIEPGQAQDTVDQNSMWQPADIGERWQQQRVEPQQEPDRKPCEDPMTMSAFPVQATNHGRHELDRRCERQQADAVERLAATGQLVIAVGQQHQDEDRKPPDQQQGGVHATAMLVVAAVAHQQWKDQVVGHHGAERKRRHYHHPGRRRKAAQVTEDRQQVAASLQRQVEHEQISIATALGHLQAGRGDRQHRQAEQQQIQRESPARREQLVAACLDRHHVELSRQAHDRTRCQQRLGEERGRQLTTGEWRSQQGQRIRRVRRHCKLKDDRHRETGDTQERQQLYNRFNADRIYDASVMHGRVDGPGAEQDREHGQRQSQSERRIDRRRYGR